METYRIWFCLCLASSQRSDVLESVCTALLEELITCNTTCSMEVNWLERRENTKETFQVPKVGGIRFQFEDLVLCWQYLCVGCEARTVQCYGNRVRVSECVAQCAYHAFRASLILQNGFIFFLWSRLPQQPSNGTAECSPSGRSFPEDVRC